MVIFRENTEDIYAGIEWPAESPEAKKVIAFLQNEMGVKKIRFPATSGIGIKPVSREGSERCARRHRLRHGARAQERDHGAQGQHHEVHRGRLPRLGLRPGQARVRRRPRGGLGRLRRQAAAGQVCIKDSIADITLQQVLTRPDEFDVIATLNLNGDYLSDALAAQVGGIGIAPGGNINYLTGTRSSRPPTAPRPSTPTWTRSTRFGDPVGRHDAGAPGLDRRRRAHCRRHGKDHRAEDRDLRLREGATEVSCSEFASRCIIANVAGARIAFTIPYQAHRLASPRLQGGGVVGGGESGAGGGGCGGIARDEEIVLRVRRRAVRCRRRSCFIPAKMNGTATVPDASGRASTWRRRESLSARKKPTVQRKRSRSKAAPRLGRAWPTDLPRSMAASPCAGSSCAPMAAKPSSTARCRRSCHDRPRPAMCRSSSAARPAAVQAGRADSRAGWVSYGFLDGQQVAMSEEEVLPHAVVTDRDDGVAITIRRDPRITGVPSPGVVVTADEIARHGELDLCGGFLQNLPIVNTYSAAQLGEVASRILPDLFRRMLVEVHSRRLPRIARGIIPRLVIDLSQIGSSLAVLPKLVYGNPPCARIDDGRLVHLSGPVPVRDEPAERRLIEKLRSDLSLLCGRRTTFEGADTARFVDKLKRWRGELAGDGAKLMGANVRLEPKLRVQAAGDTASGLPNVRFDLDFTVLSEVKGESVGGVSAAAVLSAWQDGLGLVPLDGGGFSRLCPRRGWRNTDRSWRPCSPRARATVAWPPMRCPRSDDSVRISTSRLRPAWIDWRRWPRPSNACPRRSCRGTWRRLCAPTSRSA
jgi:hypothetical protein